MFELTRGNLLEADVEAVVNTAKHGSHYGQGNLCSSVFVRPIRRPTWPISWLVRLGVVHSRLTFLLSLTTLTPPRYIINSDAYVHWRHKSRTEGIEAGPVALVAEVRRLRIPAPLLRRPWAPGWADSLGRIRGGAYGSI